MCLARLRLQPAERVKGMYCAVTLSDVLSESVSAAGITTNGFAPPVLVRQWQSLGWRAQQKEARVCILSSLNMTQDLGGISPAMLTMRIDRCVNQWIQGASLGTRADAAPASKAEMLQPSGLGE